MDMSIKNNIYWNTLLRIPFKVICFGLSVITARILFPRDFGIFAVAMMAIGGCNFITNFGMNEAVVQQRIVCCRTLSSIFTFDFVISSIMMLFFIYFSGSIAIFFNENNSSSVIKVMSIYFIISSFSGIAQSVLRRDMEFALISTIESVQDVLIYSLTLILAFMNFSYWSLAIGQIVPRIFFTIVLYKKSKLKLMLSYDHKFMKPILNFGIWNFSQSIINFIISSLDKFIIGKVVGVNGLGLYDKAKNLSVIPSESIFMSINSVMFSTFSKNKDDLNELNRYFKKSMILISIISLPIYAGSILIAPYFVSIFLGNNWVEMIVPFQLILSGFIFKSYGGMLASFNIGVGWYKPHVIKWFLAGCCFAVFSVMLVEKGIIGVAIAFLLFCVIEFFLSASVMISKLKISFFDLFSCCRTGFWSAGVMLLSGYLLVGYIFMERNLQNLILIIVSCVTIYSLCIFIDSDKDWVKMRVDLTKDLFAMCSRIIGAY